MPCLAHLHCSGCCPPHDSAGASGPGYAARMLTHRRKVYPFLSACCQASHGASQQALSTRAVQAQADKPRLVERPERPSRIGNSPAPESQPSTSLDTPPASERLRTPLPPAPLTSASDRAPLHRKRVYWRGSATSREAVLGRRLLSSNGQASVASVLQGEMLSSKQITRCAMHNSCRFMCYHSEKAFHSFCKCYA